MTSQSAPETAGDLKSSLLVAGPQPGLLLPPFTSRRHFSTPGDILGCHNWGMLSYTAQTLEGDLPKCVQNYCPHPVPEDERCKCHHLECHFHLPVSLMAHEGGLRILSSQERLSHTYFGHQRHGSGIPMTRGICKKDSGLTGCFCALSAAYRKGTG